MEMPVAIQVALRIVPLLCTVFLGGPTAAGAIRISSVETDAETHSSGPEWKSCNGVLDLPWKYATSLEVPRRSGEGRGTFGFAVWHILSCFWSSLGDCFAHSMLDLA